MPEQFTDEEKKILSPFMTNLGKPVFVLRNLPEVVKGALFSRYSRSDKSLRRVLLDEFIKKPEMGFREIVGFQTDTGTEEAVAIRKAEEFYDRVLVGFGDDSVAELGGAHIACEGVSNILSILLEDSRIGLSPLEKSTRYVWFDTKVVGNYRYYREPAIMQSPFADQYVETCDLLFKTYARLVEPMTGFVMERFPQGDASDRAYRSAVKAKACDVLRLLLPASTATNVGLFGNGRAFEYLILKLKANPLQESRDIATMMHAELGAVIPSFVKRADDRYGKEHQEFFQKTEALAANAAARNLHGHIEPTEEVTLISYGEHALDAIISALLYERAALPMEQVAAVVESMDDGEKKEIVSGYIALRRNRRHKFGRPFEHAYYKFDILANYGAYRDLHRHRMLTQIRQTLTCLHGYDIPPELVDAGYAADYKDCMHAARSAWQAIADKFPAQAQYVVPFGFRIRWNVSLNARAALHMIELRTMRQGHPDYRRVCQQMHEKITAVHPWLRMPFADMQSYGMERIEAEKRLDRKLGEIREKYGSP